MSASERTHMRLDAATQKAASNVADVKELVERLQAHENLPWIAGRELFTEAAAALMRLHNKLCEMQQKHSRPA